MFIVVQSLCSVGFFSNFVLCMICFYWCIYLQSYFSHVFQSEFVILEAKCYTQEYSFHCLNAKWWVVLQISSVEMVAGQNVPYIQIPRHCQQHFFLWFLQIILYFACQLDAKWLIEHFEDDWHRLFSMQTSEIT